MATGGCRAMVRQLPCSLVAEGHAEAAAMATGGCTAMVRLLQWSLVAVRPWRVCCHGPWWLNDYDEAGATPTGGCRAILRLLTWAVRC